MLSRNSSADHRNELEEENKTPDTTSSMEEQTTFPTLSKGHGSNANYFSSFQVMLLLIIISKFKNHYYIFCKLHIHNNLFSFDKGKFNGVRTLSK